MGCAFCHHAISATTMWVAVWRPFRQVNTREEILVDILSIVHKMIAEYLSCSLQIFSKVLSIIAFWQLYCKIQSSLCNTMQHSPRLAQFIVLLKSFWVGSSVQDTAENVGGEWMVVWLIMLLKLLVLLIGMCKSALFVFFSGDRASPVIGSINLA